MIEVALFGAGRIGSIHAGNLVRQPGVRPKYIADGNRAAAGAREVGRIGAHARRGRIRGTAPEMAFVPILVPIAIAVGTAF